jgi:hypothetical protein
MIAEHSCQNQSGDGPEKKNLSYWMTGLTHEKAVFIRTTLFDFLFFFC